jgi:hypothetical protein
MKSTAFQDAYFRFTQLLVTLENSPSFPKLDDVEGKLLHSIALATRSGQALLVGDIIFSNKLGSPATLHKRLGKLIEKDLIQYAEDTDARKKFLELTPKSQKYFNKLGECLLKASTLK